MNAGSNSFVEVPFSYPVGQVDFWVKVVGQDGYTVLGNFDLDNGEIIQLMGGGTFYLTIYSNRGSGYWNASYTLAGGGTTTGGGDVIVNGPAIGAWEPLDVLSYGDRGIVLRTIDGTHYLRMRSDGIIDARATKLAEATVFTVSDLGIGEDVLGQL